MSCSPIFHVDVFASGPITGNGLAVFLDTENWSFSIMMELAKEMKQFESIFLSKASRSGAKARVFTVDEELPFAGHPVLGAAAVLHRTQTPDSEHGSWNIMLPSGPVRVATRRMESHYVCEMNQGNPIFGKVLDREELRVFLTGLKLDEHDLLSYLPAQVISTGLPYLIIPVSANGLAKSKITINDLGSKLSVIGAKFLLVIDVEAREMRTWDNLGHVEDVATGSAAGPVGAYLVAHGIGAQAFPIELSQGRYAGRPSKLVVIKNEDGHMIVQGSVWPVSCGTLEINAASL